MLLRLEHYFEVGEDPLFSLPVKVDLARAFAELRLDSFVEMTLGGNQNKATAKRLKWRAKNGQEVGGEAKTTTTTANTSAGEGAFLITLKPMQIRTFVAKKG